MEKKNLKTISDAELEQATGGCWGGQKGGSACASIFNSDECTQAGCCWYENVACVDASSVNKGMMANS